MKKILFFIFSMFFSVSHAVEYAPIANIEYIHTAIANKYDITVPYNPALSSPQLAANMKYLLTTIDVANQMRGNSTSYGSGTYATEFAANTITADTAIDTLIKAVADTPDIDDNIDPDFPLSITTTSTTSSFSFSISAAGDFYVDWGDNSELENISRTSTSSTKYSHTYDAAGEYTIRIGGKATKYSTSASTAAISFASNYSVAKIDGSLGYIFPTLSDGSQPRFYQTFYYNRNLSAPIPKTLFSGISGTPVSSMFYQTFYNCSYIPEIPAGLFGGMSGNAQYSIFYQTFYNCSSIQQIPENLFGNLSGSAAGYMFYQTFAYCTGLTGEIPLGLFGNFSDPSSKSYMFYRTFYNCSGLTGPSARMPNGTYIYNYFTSSSSAYYPFSGTYYGCTSLSDYADIPSGSK